MSGFISDLKSYFPDPKRREQKAVKDSRSYLTRVRESNAWRLIKRYSRKFWNWFKVDNWRWALKSLIVAGIIHILAVINLPAFAPKSAWFRLQNDLPVNTMKLLPTLDKEQPVLPMLAPDIRYAICRYDLSKGPVTIKTDIPNQLFSIAAYNNIGQNFYIISGQALQRDKLFMIITQNKYTAEEEVSASEEADDVIVVKSAEKTGILLLRAPVQGPSYENQVETILSNAICETKN